MNMWGHHPLRESLVSYVRDELPLPQRRKVGKHLSSCPLCQRKAHKISVESSQGLAGLGYEAAIKRAAEGTREWLNRFNEETRHANSLLATLLESESGDLDRINDSLHTHTLKLCQLLQERCRATWFQEPIKAVELAHMAAAVSDRLSESQYGSGVVADARARSWAILGNSYRIVSEFEKAEQALRAASEHQKLSGDLLTESEILSAWAILRKFQGRFREATTTLDRVIHISREGDDHSREGRALIVKGTVVGEGALAETGNFQDAIRFLRKGVSRIDSSAASDLVLAARHNIVFLLNESGRALEAWQMLEQERHLYHDLDKQRHFTKLYWLEGKISAELGYLEKAKCSFQRARELILEQRIPRDLGFVSLDLSLVLGRQGRRNEAKHLLDAEVIPILDAVGTYQDSIAARLLFFRLS